VDFLEMTVMSLTSPTATSTARTSPAPTFSIVIPTFRRRELVSRCLAALSRQDVEDFEVIVVVDGSTDGTAGVLRQLPVPFPLTVIEQRNQGAAAARNRGVGAARGRLLLFLDDDMEADPGLLRAHEAAHRNGADAVVGHIPLHPDTPRSFVTDGTARWTAQRARRLESTGGVVTIDDVLTGQLSVRCELFTGIGRFDEAFTNDGTFGNEDTDLGRRLLDGGHRVVYARDAVTWQRYVVGPEDLLRQARQLGRADVRYLDKHPAEAQRIRRVRHAGAVWNRWGWRPLTRRPAAAMLVATGLQGAVLQLARRNARSRTVGMIFSLLRDLEYWRGVREAEASSGARSLRVLCYHSISDLQDAPVISEYGVPPADFRAQLTALRCFGYTFVTIDEVLRFLDGVGQLPRQPVLVTFDDCFVDLLHNAVPVLQSKNVPAVAFAVAGQIGGTNAWDTAIGAPGLELLDEAGLEAVQSAGVEIGVHGRTHRPMCSVPEAELPAETGDAADELCRNGIKPPRILAYPHGSQDRRVRRAVGAAGFVAAFTVAPGVVRRRSDRLALNRIEVLRADGTGARFLAKVALAALPGRNGLHRLRGFPRAARGVVAAALPQPVRRRLSRRNEGGSAGE
jgi:glycosyltransferase involved in cell wall biosynthesis/peptidoglycan/xylan/chitin deacetylase (PgdA/CDA1 family)